MELNNLQEKVKLYNIGLSDSDTSGQISLFTRKNFGKSIIEKGEGDIVLKAIDTITKEEHFEKINLLKIDIEGKERDCLNGAINTIKKYKPLILLETYEEFELINKILSELNYELVKEYPSHNFLFKCKSEFINNGENNK